MTNKVIAITGGIGSGKSTVIEILRELGYSTLDCDRLAREVSEQPEVAEEVRALLGGEYVSDGKLDRRAIREKVFTDEALLSQYNAIFFARVRRILEERLASADGTVFVEISVFDAFDFPWDGIWLVESSVDERKRRVIVRDGVSENNVFNVMSRQRICSDYTLKIINDGDITELKRQVATAVKEIE